MHREQLPRIVPVERDQVGDLLALGLGHLEALARLVEEFLEAPATAGPWSANLEKAPEEEECP